MNVLKSLTNVLQYLMLFCLEKNRSPSVGIQHLIIVPFAFISFRIFWKWLISTWKTLNTILLTTSCLTFHQRTDVCYLIHSKHVPPNEGRETYFLRNGSHGTKLHMWLWGNRALISISPSSRRMTHCKINTSSLPNTEWSGEVSGFSEVWSPHDPLLLLKVLSRGVIFDYKEMVAGEGSQPSAATWWCIFHNAK